MAFSESHVTEKSGLQPVNTIRGSQLKQPLFEFSGACAGCGEPIARKVSTKQQNGLLSPSFESISKCLNTDISNFY